jgi:hypothetical protein
MEHRLELQDGSDWYVVVDAIQAVIDTLDREFATRWERTVSEGVWQPDLCSWQEKARGRGEITLSWGYPVHDWFTVYCWVPDELEARAVKLLHDHLHPMSLEEIQASAERGGRWRAHAVRKLGEAQHRAFDARTAAIVVAALDSSDASVRWAAAAAMSSLSLDAISNEEWSSFAPALRAAIPVETDPYALNAMQQALEYCSRNT